MAKQTINVGINANDRRGDPLRIAFTKINENFDEVYDDIPTSLGDLENDVGFVTSEEIPTRLSDLENDAGFATANSIPVNLSDLENDVGFVTSEEIPTKVSDLENDESFITNETSHIILTQRYVLGEPVSFSNQSDASLTDEIGPGLIIARNPGGGGIYNAAVENEYDQINRESPIGTLWNYEGNGFGNLDTIKNRYYTTFSEALKHQVGRNILGSDLVMHDTINDKYYKIEFTHWGIQAVGTFAYTRTEIIPVNVGVEFPDGSYQPTAWTGYLNRYNKIHVGPFSGHELAEREAGSVIYFFNTHVTLPNNLENGCPIGSFYTLVIGNERAFLRVKKYSNTNLIPVIESAIEPITNVPPFNDTEYPLEAYSIAHLIKIERNRWSLVPAGVFPTDISELTDTEGLLDQASANTGNIAFDDVTISSPEDEDLFIKAGDDLYLDALGDDVFIRAKDDIRLRTNYDFETDDYSWQFRFTSSGNQIFFNGNEDEEYGRITPEDEDEIRGLTLEGREQVRIRISDTDQDLVFSSNGDLTTSGGINTFGVITTTEDIVLKESGSETGRITARVSDGAGLQVQASLDFEINVIGSEEETTIWSFESNGGIVFPDSTIQTTAFTGNSISNGDSSVNIPDEDGSVIVTVSANNGIATWQFEIGGDVPIIRTPSGAGSSIFNETLMQMSASSNDWYSDVVAQEGEVFISVGNDGEGGGITFLGVSSSGVAITSFGNSTSNLNVAGNITGNILQIEVGAHEKFQSKADATGIVEHDCSSGHIFYHTSPDANWTANITNLNLENNYATSVTIIVDQGGTGYYPSALQIDGVSQTINWQGNTTPTPSVNRTDVVTFSIVNNGGAYIVLGQLTGF